MNMTANRAGHFGLLALVAAFVLWFTASAWRADPTLVNMILIGPVAALALCLVAAIAAGLLMHPARDASHPEGGPGDGSLRSRFGVAIGCVAFLLYVLALEPLGYDAAGMAFCAGTMILMGQRNWIAIGVYAVLTGLVPVWILQGPMGMPVPTMFLE
ncbi:tripartite tricarboxylate transporter TctB family protein [Falsirhodobacter halotolerans]|uniref:tripartite tricarboxylate transporter TctB family protein n=1 Tax=Falsirhodobacter halotolerans TaxID=1146892 RepID=UPI001FD4F88A|nr:tripartite tricarboxylate transporter TctB family protein [Falsirhodobacter halotolerans]MCJ8141025.1 tripartite tricarboxylate transporter TctB family protein [Falsirhodobacter halotolerans]